MLIRHRAVRKDKHGGVRPITDADATSGRPKRPTSWRATKKDADATSDLQKRRTTWRATNSGCLYGIVLSEKTKMLLQHRAATASGLSTVHRHNQASDAPATAK